MNKTYHFDLTKVEKKEKFASHAVPLKKPSICQCAHCKKNEVREQVDTLQRSEVPIITGSQVREGVGFTGLTTTVNILDEAVTHASRIFWHDSSALHNGFSSGVPEQEEGVHRNQRAANGRMEIESEDVSSPLSASEIQRFI